MDQDQDETMASSLLQDKDQRLQWEPENGAILVVFLFFKCRLGFNILQENSALHIFRDGLFIKITNDNILYEIPYEK